ncbi:MAG: hypothetical protein GY830_03930 [Bacteroidetes bacterium]|nr:hypothetical protein [Bacteroidota bacterium]
MEYLDYKRARLEELNVIETINNRFKRMSLEQTNFDDDVNKKIDAIGFMEIGNNKIKRPILAQIKSST